MGPQRLFGMTPWVRRLLVANVLVFLLQQTIFVGPWFITAFGFDPLGALELCRRIPGLGLTLDPSHYLVGPHGERNYDALFPYVRHVRLRDTGKKPEDFQVRVGQGELEYGRIISHLAKHRYDRGLTVDVRSVPDRPFPVEPEMRKLKYLLESLCE